LEPFAGSASLFFSLSPHRAILSDLNGDLIRTWSAIQKEPEKVFRSLRTRPVSSDYYYTLRKNAYTNKSDFQSAARFLYLNRFCFNGIYRTNENGVFNVPFSGIGNGKKPSLEHIRTCSNQLKKARIIHGDFEHIVRQNLRRNDFVYLDPPYVTGARRIFREYVGASFNMNDLERLATLLEDINNKKAFFVLSYAYCSEAKKMFLGWRFEKYFVQRNVAGFAKNRRMAAELLVTNISS
jgi:DNA adenine methylase